MLSFIHSFSNFIMEKKKEKFLICMWGNCNLIWLGFQSCIASRSIHFNTQTYLNVSGYLRLEHNEEIFSVKFNIFKKFLKIHLDFLHIFCHYSNISFTNLSYLSFWNSKYAAKKWCLKPCYKIIQIGFRQPIYNIHSRAENTDCF